ncbi:MAG: hypothetical protein NTY38_00890 [Acidobacteria bacterium]|nr:hypothetical protein [Acidobacteriota bacterium]
MALPPPLGLRRDPASGLTVVRMAPPEDCFAVSTPQQKEGHYSLYLSLFGRTIQAGETALAHARMVVAVSPDSRQVVKTYRKYRRQRSGRGRMPAHPPV